MGNAQFKREVERFVESFADKPKYLDAISLWAINPTTLSAGYALELNKPYFLYTLSERYPEEPVKDMISDIEDSISMLRRLWSDVGGAKKEDVFFIREGTLESLYPKYTNILTENAKRLISSTTNRVKLALVEAFKGLLRIEGWLGYDPKSLNRRIDWGEGEFSEALLEREYMRVNSDPFPGSEALLSTGVVGKAFYRSASGKTSGVQYVTQHHVPQALATMDIPSKIVELPISPNDWIVESKKDSFPPETWVIPETVSVLPFDGHEGCGRVCLVPRLGGDRVGSKLLDQILEHSESFVKLIDAFASEVTLKRLLESGCKDIRILTTRSILEEFAKLDNLQMDYIVSEMKKAEDSGRKMEMKFTDMKSDTGSPYKWIHDRILITKDHAWSFSTSMKDITNNRKTSLIIYLPEDIRRELEEDFDRMWKLLDSGADLSDFRELYERKMKG